MISNDRQSFGKWCDEFSGALNSVACNPFSKDQAALITALRIAEREGRDLPDDLLDEMKQTLLYQLVEKRAQWLGLKISVGAMCLICEFFPSPGQVVMFLSVLASKKQRGEIVTVTVRVIEQVLPWGLPDFETLHHFWNWQKVDRVGNCGSDNLLDNKEVPGWVL